MARADAHRRLETVLAAEAAEAAEEAWLSVSRPIVDAHRHHKDAAQTHASAELLLAVRPRARPRRHTG